MNLQRQAGFVMVLLLLLVALGVSVWVSLGITTRDRWPIRWLEVQGQFDRVSAEQLRASLIPLTDSSFFTLDMDALRETAVRIPWVSAVKVEKRWPDTVVVTIDEYRPVAHWNATELVSVNGERFSVPEAAGLQGLPWLEGPDQHFEELLRQWSEYNQVLSEHGLEVARLKQDKRGAWQMVLGNATEVRIGRDAPAERLQRLLASWPVLMQNQEVPPESIDLRYTNGIAVNWREPGEIDNEGNPITGR